MVKSTFWLFNLYNGEQIKGLLQTMPTWGKKFEKTYSAFGPVFNFVWLQLWPIIFISVHP